MVLALVLGDMAESSFRQSMLLSQGSIVIFWANPLVAAIMALAMLLLFWPLYAFLRDRRRQPLPAGG
jgi:putative tricarboxylic transport membrane protein